MSAPENYLLVANPTAQSGKAKAQIDRVLARMRKRGMSVKFLATLPGGATVEALRDAIDGGDVTTIISMGGDGTFAEVGKGILGASREVKMAMLPSGTANDQGRSFGVQPGSQALERNLDIMAAGYVVRLDVGHLERLGPDGQTTHTDLFFDSAGWGLQPEILAVRNRDRDVVSEIPILRDVYRDMAVYAGALVNRTLQSLVEPVKFDAEIVVDGETFQYRGLTDLIVNATPVYGGNWVLDRHAEADDGLFELIPIAGRRDWFSKALRDLAKVPIWQEELDMLGVVHTEGTSGATFELNLLRPGGDVIRSQIDGEEWVPGDAYRVSVLHGALPLTVPEDFDPPWKQDLLSIL